jgi:hypothetical protein
MISPTPSTSEQDRFAVALAIALLLAAMLISLIHMGCG